MSTPGFRSSRPISAYREVARETEETVASLPDPDREVPLPEAPWFPPGTA